MRTLCTRAFLVFFLGALALPVDSAHAQASCPAASSVTENGPIAAGSFTTHQIDLLPCQTVNFVVNASRNHPWSTAIGIAAFNDQNAQLFSWSAVAGNVSATVLATPYTGVVGVHGNLKSIKFSNANFTLDSSSVTIIKLPRPGWNIGGDSFSTAPQIFPDVDYFGSTNQYEDGQFFKVRLGPQATMSISGHIHRYVGNWTATTIIVFDSAFVQKKLMVNQAVGYYAFPTNPSVPLTFTNPLPVEATYYLRIKSQNWALHEFKLRVAQIQGPQLSLFLDADNNFNPASPTTDIATYIPGASLTDGSSVALPQTIKVIAAYIDIGGGIVTPPSSEEVQFGLSNISAFKGVAMNASDPAHGDDDNDFVPDGSTSVAFGIDKTARFTLKVWDYGGVATVTAVQNSISATPLRLPRDDNNNSLPDAGWKAGLDEIQDPGDPEAKTADADGTPAAFEPPTDPENRGLVGDGLSAFEEYRGFRVNGIHVRTSPAKKDLFVAGGAESNWGLGFVRALEEHLVRVHALCDTTLAAGCGVTEYSADRVVNFARQNAQGSAITGFDQKGVRLLVMATALDPLFQGDCTYGFTWDVNAPEPMNIQYVPLFMTPNETRRVEVYSQQIAHFGDPVNYNACGSGLPGPMTSEQVDNEIRRTIAHEVGHSIHLCHKPFAPACNLQIQNPGVSVMTNEPTGAGAAEAGGRYSSDDIGQIRLHVRF
jgi:hypothetical protein